jgi:ribosomal protein S18 acetylase RimI-like enzyme
LADVVVRRVRPEDALRLRDVRLRALATDPASFGSTHAREAVYPDERWCEWAEDDAEGGVGATLLALDEDEQVGLVIAARDDDDPHRFHVYSMWVAPEVRRMGVGRRLLTAVEDWIRAAGGREVHLSVTNEAAAAQRLYESAGYEADGVRTASRHTPGVVEIGLRKRLA